MFQDGWGGMEQRPARFYGEEIYERVLPATVAALDPSRAYISGSPLDPASGLHSDSHYWDVWHGRGDWLHYCDCETRFCSEFGFASSCSMACWEQVLAPEDYTPHSVAVRWHDKTGKPLEVFEAMVELHYPRAETLEDWVYYSQLNQRDALRCGIEHFRLAPCCRGSLIWQFNDCWPVQSWAVQDYARTLKPAGFELRRLYEALMLTIDEQFQLHVINDSPRPYSGVCEIDFVSLIDGSTSKAVRIPVELGQGARLALGRHAPPTETAIRFSLADGSAETWRLPCEPKACRLIQPTITATVSDRLIIEVEGFAADLVLWDPGDPYNLLDPLTGQPGWKAHTLANGSFAICFHKPPVRLHARSLAGSHRVDLVQKP
jgi:beta-mannosidase